MAKQAILSLANFEDPYFEDRMLIGIRTKLCGTQLCHELQTKLNLKFVRDLGNEAVVNFKVGSDSGLGIAGTLFESIRTEETVFFPVFEYTPPYTDESCISIFENYNNDHCLVPECRQYNFIVMLKDEDFQLRQRGFLYWLSQIPSLQQCSVLTVEDLGASKQNLVM